jgi:hypothetical protein
MCFELGVVGVVIELELGEQFAVLSPHRVRRVQTRRR